MTPEIMRQYLAAHAPELEVVELPEAHTTDYISREWKPFRPRGLAGEQN
jgi:hypothetical protein